MSAAKAGKMADLAAWHQTLVNRVVYALNEVITAAESLAVVGERKRLANTLGIAVESDVISDRNADYLEAQRRFHRELEAVEVELARLREGGAR